LRRIYGSQCRCPLATRVDQLPSLFAVGEHASDCPGPTAHVVGIDENAGVADEIGKRRRIGRHDRASGGHRLDVADVEAMDFAELGPFDAAVCSGILYHLQRPWDLLASLAQVTPAVFLWTHYWGDENSAVPYGRYLVKEVPETFPEPRLRGLAPVSRWLCRDSLFRAARDAGFTAAQVLAEGGEGPAWEITLALRR